MRKLSALIIISLGGLFVFYSIPTRKNPRDEKKENSSLDKQWAKSFIDSINTKFSEQLLQAIQLP